MSSQRERGGEGQSGGGNRGRGGKNVVVCRLLPSLGGVERGVVEVANHLADEGVHNIVACSGGAMAAQLRSDVTLVSVPSRAVALRLGAPCSDSEGANKSFEILGFEGLNIQNGCSE
ncbi:hypothetical protein T484DRAFT_1817854 [Baffinella frigidus]|nr:hypothetical protein T484DRAFT_1817854 [Cryptophyta sp. CCMP2293]